jgi:transposase-like protein
VRTGSKNILDRRSAVSAWLDDTVHNTNRQARSLTGTRLKIMVESIDARIRKAAKARGHFLTETAALKYGTWRS